MSKGKMIAGLIGLIVSALLLAGLIGLIQRLLISGTQLVNQMGTSVSEEQVIGGETERPVLVITEDDFNDPNPIVTMEPEELFSVPVEETIEELAQENEEKQNQ